MPLSYAGVGLGLATPAYQEWVDRLIPPAAARDWSGWHYDGHFGKESRPVPEWPRQPPIRLGRLRWPTGATRPAFFHAVAGDTMLARIAAALSTLGTKYADLVLDAGQGPVTARMYPLPPRPLDQAALADRDGENLWLLTLVDQRFYLSFREIWIASPPATWASLIGMLGATAGPVDAAYLAPTRRWVGQLPVPASLDAAARMVGQRVVADMATGNLSTVTWEAAQADSDAQYDQFSLTAGGQFPLASIAKTVPSQITVQFPVDDETRASWYEPYKVTLSLASLEIDGYGDATGVGGYTANVTADQPYTTFNAADLNTLATRAATDWYGWRLADLDVTFPLVQPWAPTGWEDAVEWFYGIAPDGDLLATTTLRRGPWDEYKAADPNPPRPPVLTVRCTDDQPADNTPVGAACFPAVVVQTGTQASTYPDGVPVWLTILGGTTDGQRTIAKAPQKGEVYEGTESGLVRVGGENRPRVYSTCAVCGAQGSQGSGSSGGSSGSLPGSASGSLSGSASGSSGSSGSIPSGSVPSGSLPSGSIPSGQSGSGGCCFTCVTAVDLANCTVTYGTFCVTVVDGQPCIQQVG